MNSWIILKLLLPIFLVFIVFFAVILALKHYLNAKSFSYKRQDYLLSKAEKNFYDVLRLALNGKPVLLFVKVRLLDVIHPAEKNVSALNKVQSKHLDFLVCDKNYISPLLAIELDDLSHVMLKRVERDNFLEAALASANLPLLRFPVQKTYDVSDVKQKIHEYVKVGL